MRTSMAYFAGAGTVVVAIAVGLGGGLVISNVMSPHDAPMSKVERRAAADRQAQPSQAPQTQPSPSPVTASDATQESSAYLAEVQPAANAPVTVNPAPSNSPKAEAAASMPPTAATTDKTASHETVGGSVDAKPAEAKPSELKAVEAKSTETRSTETKSSETKSTDGKSPQSSPSQQASRDQNASPDNAYAKARDADLKQLEAKKKADRAERRQQWAARRAQQRDQEMRDVERQVREDSARQDSDAREVIVRRDSHDLLDRDDDDRSDFGRPARFDFPRMLFGRD